MLRETAARVRGFKIFHPEVEAVLKALATVAVLTVMVLLVAWGYQQRSEARVWREIACAYRLKEALSDGRLVTDADLGTDPCVRLDELGLPRVARRAD
jgi:hypothetical protein